jgi:hypothetical protein
MGRTLVRRRGHVWLSTRLRRGRAWPYRPSILSPGLCAARLRKLAAAGSETGAIGRPLTAPRPLPKSPPAFQQRRGSCRALALSGREVPLRVRERLRRTQPLLLQPGARAVWLRQPASAGTEAGAIMRRLIPLLSLAKRPRPAVATSSPVLHSRSPRMRMGPSGRRRRRRLRLWLLLLGACAARLLQLAAAGTEAFATVRRRMLLPPSLLVAAGKLPSALMTHRRSQGPSWPPTSRVALWRAPGHADWGRSRGIRVPWRHLLGRTRMQHQVRRPPGGPSLGWETHRPPPLSLERRRPPVPLPREASKYLFAATWRRTASARGATCASSRTAVSPPR